MRANEFKVHLKIQLFLMMSLLLLSCYSSLASDLENFKNNAVKTLKRKYEDVVNDELNENTEKLPKKQFKSQGASLLYQIVTKKNSLLVGQGEAAFLNQHDKKAFIITTPLKPCQAIVIWNSITKEIFLGHRDQWINMRYIVDLIKSDKFKDVDNISVTLYSYFMDNIKTFKEYGYETENHQELLLNMKLYIIENSGIKRENVKLIFCEKENDICLGIGVNKNTGKLFYPILKQKKSYLYGSELCTFFDKYYTYHSRKKERNEIIEKTTKFIEINKSNLLRKSLLKYKNNNNETYVFKSTELNYPNGELFAKYKKIKIIFKFDKINKKIVSYTIKVGKFLEYFDFYYPYSQIKNE